jgi:hypothetical protein
MLYHPRKLVEYAMSRHEAVNKHLLIVVGATSASYKNLGTLTKVRRLLKLAIFCRDRARAEQSV